MKGCAEQGRDVFAVPGSILTKRHLGTNTLISDGATPVLTPEAANAILDAVPWSDEPV